MLILCFIFALCSPLAFAKPQRIIGGEHARAGEFPFSVAIEITKSDGKYFCGGALVNRQWILTSGHCVNNYMSFAMHLGSVQRQDDAAGVKVASTYAVKHRDFDPDGFKADVALILLHMPIIMTDYIKTIRLPLENITSDRPSLAIGWGETSDSSSAFSDVLNFVAVVPLSNDECKSIYGDVITDDIVCAVGNLNEGTCTGDTGGPLVQYVTGIPYHAGIASFQSQNGCETPEPSGFTRTFPYVEWIKSFIGE